MTDATNNPIRLAMLGMVDGNGHPYSWSAIINGRYDSAAMARCGYPVIPEYLGAQPAEALGIDGAEVTCVWCDDPADGPRVAEAACIETVLAEPTDAIGAVDAVVIATDKGEEHLDRARPFVEAGLPVFIDKPLTIVPDHLAQFRAWVAEGRPIYSTSAMRYAEEFRDVGRWIEEVGQVRTIVMTGCKSWERYGIHALEGVYPLVRPGGWRSVSNTGDEQSNVVHLRHADGVEVILPVVYDQAGAFGCLGVYGTEGYLTTKFTDTFTAFKRQLVAFVEAVRTGQPPVPFEQTDELMRLIIAGIVSRNEGGRRVAIEEIA